MPGTLAPAPNRAPAPTCLHVPALLTSPLHSLQVFRAVYEAVGLGWVYAITKIPIVLTLANKVYDVWASNRTQLTGREALSVIVERRRLEEAGKASCRTPQTAGAQQQCDV